MKLIQWLPPLFLLTASCVAMAQWQWIDKDGHKVYSDRAPPLDIPAKNILKQPNGLGRPWEPTTDAAPPAVAPKPSASATAAAEASKKAASEEEVRRKTTAQSCDRARASLTVLRSGIRLKTANARGEIEAINDTERTDEIERLQGFVNTECK